MHYGSIDFIYEKMHKMKDTYSYKFILKITFHYAIHSTGNNLSHHLKLTEF
jgi:hypothetical protein